MRMDGQRDSYGSASILWRFCKYIIETNSMEKNICEVHSHPVCQDIPHILWNPEFHCRALTNPSLDPILSSNRTLITHLLEANFIVLIIVLRALRWYFHGDLNPRSNISRSNHRGYLVLTCADHHVWGLYNLEHSERWFYRLVSCTKLKFERKAGAANLECRVFR
jgi:hypothetical protein